MPSRNVVLLLGAPRSGTTWLAKLLDSHPDVLYRHEPDIVVREDRLPMVCDRADVRKHRELARQYLNRLIATTTVKTVGSRPVFAKSHSSWLRSTVRAGLINVLRMAELAGRAPKALTQLPVPDMLGHHCAQDLRIAIKSVSALGRARLFKEALPGSHMLLLLRHPCGQVASVLRGATLGKFDAPRMFDKALLESEPARRHGLTTERLSALPAVEQAAWHWAVNNEKAVEDLAGLSGVKTVIYEELCAAPMERTQEIFAFAGLSWSQQTETFLTASTRHRGPERYYQIFRDPIGAANRWRTQLDTDDQRRILNVARQTSIGHHWAE